MSFESLPSEILVLVCENLDAAGLNVLARTCSLMFSLLDPLLYQQAVKSDAYKVEFLHAVIHRQADAVSKFLKAGVSMSAFEDNTEDAIFIRSHSRCISVEKRRALKRAPHPLLAAAHFGNIDVIRVLLNEGNVDIDFQDYSGNTALHCAIGADHPDMIKLLLEQGARMGNYHKRQGVRSPFVHAAQFGNKRAVELMFNKLQLHNRDNQLEELCGPKKAIFDESIKRLCEEACYEACQNGYLNIIDFLLYQGVNVNHSVHQRHLLYWATLEGSISIVKLLVKYGARMECERDCGVVTLLYKRGSWDEKERDDPYLGILTHLLRSGCNVANGGIHACALWGLAKYSGSEGHRSYATSHQREEIMGLLLENGFDQKKCQHGCFKRKGYTSLIPKMRGQSIVKYVEEQELRMKESISYPAAS
ncbi:uncharacterized protein TRUGW13939_06481 [Talaromyces rugulosus]|uniref:F-box domain-containing protein n=1 Tax=Talaromyces rugulosus TaxID=121627 RepID=A0A7H8QZE1_TALRU|nr:uncharacterized protein TRUGW13939_06481 [Talaromyces rugulosus]QKX59347.1 hypothetical protein TRUGW13939_06481 [Talaromyces rugulosus]